MIYLLITFSLFVIMVLSLADTKAVNSKVISDVVYFSFAIFMFILFSFGYENADIHNYQELYNNLSLGGDGYITSQIGLVILMKLFISFGLSYHAMLSLIFVVSITLLTLTIRKYSLSYNLTLILYFIFPFFLDVVQIKQFFAMSVVVYALKYIYEKESILKWTLCIVVAFSFHYSAIFFFPIMFIRNYNTKKILKFSIFLCVISFTMVYLNLIQRFILPIFGELRVSAYIKNGPQFGFILLVLIQVSISLVSYFSIEWLKNRHVENGYFRAVQLANIYAINIIPLYAINGNFERIFRMLYIPNYIIICTLLMVIGYKKRVFAQLFVVISLVILSSWTFRGILDRTLYPIIESNYLFDYIEIF